MTYLIQQMPTFAQWHAAVGDMRAKIAIARRSDRASAGNLGDAWRRGCRTAGRGDKSSQDADIRRAKKRAKEV